MANKQANPCLQGIMGDLLKTAQTGTDSAVKIYLCLYVFRLEYQRNLEIPDKNPSFLELFWFRVKEFSMVAPACNKTEFFVSKCLVF